MNFILSPEQLTTSFQEEQFRLLTQRQLIKEFQFVGIQLEESFYQTVFSTDFILETIKKNVSLLVNQSHQTFIRLMYQIDIPESSYNTCLNSIDFDSQISHLILRRCAYKVFLRSKF